MNELNYDWDLAVERGRGGLRGHDSVGDDFPLGAEGYYIAHMNDSVATPSDDSSHDTSAADSGLRGRDLWIKRLDERQL